MLRWERGTVSAVTSSWPGVDRLEIDLDDGAGTLSAIAYEELTGRPRAGEQVLLNTNAVRRELGTGGDAMVVARTEVLPETADVRGHMVKARYTPMQTMVDALDDPDSEHYETVREATGIDGMPVVVADLHSSLPAIVAGIRARRRSARIAYVHTDAAALPAVYSKSAARLREAGLLTAVISAGQSFGGDLEAVTVHSALLGARHVVGADVAIVIQGPGNLGTGTGWGFSGIQTAESLHAASVLGGVPIATLRVSEADERERHRGLSHHSSTAYGRALLAPVHLPVLPRTDSRYNSFHESVRKQVKSTILKPAKKRGVLHHLTEVDAKGLRDALEEMPVRMTTMGRTLAEDYASFQYAALAGRCAAEHVRGAGGGSGGAKGESKGPKGGAKR
ncbi:MULTISPECIES: DUF3866 family protein [Brachybacterium]|uniref:DUF3866 domain-containing protein n=2 Tax=Brachybacterium TaxID=43668 RepID=A0A3R8X7N0_9MICO|nr:DUF3866 family protein [Brachybacterium paraconglomeratum]RRR19697.1 DUF3866 domain-containing protein [Brachybacterium paraconglomeratum]GLI31380.1 hypothetical protein BCONGLO52_22210 [Brachybacterium conglomeratum]GLK04292.1 hypothetical protein GCM10017597_10910 [Brachybacterium conglomeratum]